MCIRDSSSSSSSPLSLDCRRRRPSTGLMAAGPGVAASESRTPQRRRRSRGGLDGRQGERERSDGGHH
eukprot:7349621-Pyramimonas_sp.AAC.2